MSAVPPYTSPQPTVIHIRQKPPPEHGPQVIRPLPMALPPSSEVINLWPIMQTWGEGP